MRNVLCPFVGRLGSVPVLTVPSEVLMLTRTVSVAALGFTTAAAVIKPEVLSKGTRIRLAAVTAGAVAS